MEAYRYVLFDLDGTLLDTQKGIISAIVRTVNEYGKSIPDNSTLQRLIGPPIQHSFRNLFNLSDSDAMDMANVFREYYKSDEFLFLAEPYEGVYELLDYLISMDVKIGVATYKRDDYAKRLLHEKGFDKFTSYLYGSDFDGKMNKENIILRCLDEMGCDDFSKAIYVGDSISDGKAANALGISFVAVTYGFGFKETDDAKIFNPIFTVNKCSEISLKLRQYCFN